MALDFTPITAGATGKVVKEDSFTPEFVAEFTEAWEHLKSGNSLGLSVVFPDAKTRDDWFNRAVAYGKREGVAVTRVKGTDSMNKEHGKLSFKMEDTKARDQRVADQAAKAQRVMILKSYGYEVVTGSKTPEITAAEDEILKRHYAKSVAEQEKHLANWMNPPAKEAENVAKPATPKPGPVHNHDKTGS